MSKESVDSFIWNGKTYNGNVEWNRLKCDEWPFIQSIDPYYYEDVVIAEGATADELYSGFTIWAAENFKDAKEATVLSDAINHVIIIKGNKTTCLKGIWEAEYCYYRIHFSLKIQTKEGRFKYEVSNMTLKGHDRYWGEWEYSVEDLKPENYFSRKPGKKKGTASVTPFSLCTAIDGFGSFLSTSLRMAANSRLKNDDW